MDVNLRGHVFCTQAIGKDMIKNRCGKIINVASILGMIGVPYASSYCASKAGLILFTKSLALEWTRYNIQVNALAPGLTDTAMPTSPISCLDLVRLHQGGSRLLTDGPPLRVNQAGFRFRDRERSDPFGRTP